MSKQPIVIVGGGIVGLSTAYELSERGHDVIVLDREMIHDSASCGNAGMLSIGHPPLTRPGVSVRGLKWMLDPTSPLYIRPRLDPGLISWLWTFHQHCNQGHLNRCMVTLCQMGWRSLDRFERTIDAESIDCGYRRTGWLDVVLHEENMDAAEAEAAMLAPQGFTHERLDGAALRAMSPCFTDEVAGAVLHKDSANIDPRAYTKGLARALERRGVRVLTGPAWDATGLERDGTGRATGVVCANGTVVSGASVVLAAGVWSTSLAADVGLDLPMQGARGYHVQLDGMPAVPATACVLHETFIAVTPMGGRLRLAGTLEISPLDAPPMPRRLAMLADGARAYLRGTDHARASEHWSGWRPCLADGMPAIGWVPGVEGLMLATGHAMLGMTLGPVTGELVADLIDGRRPSIDLSMVEPARLAVAVA